MKTYYYSLNEKNTISHITEEVIDYYTPIELTDEQFESIILFRTSIKDNNLIDMGEDQETIILNNKTQAINTILGLKELLFETDWKAIINIQCLMQDLPIKYEGLDEQRQAWRDEINKLEEELKTLESILK